MDSQRLAAYLERIGLDEMPPATMEGVKRIQRAHLETVPFENLDMLAGKVPLALDEDGLFDKIVTRRRGGICYELNYLLRAALEAMGFAVHIAGGRIYDDGTEFDHVFLIVEDPEAPDARWLVDVGFAYNFAAPLRFAPGVVQEDGRLAYRIDETRDGEDTWYHVMRLVGDEEEFMFAFRDIYREVAEFDERRVYFETNPNSRFLKGPLVCIDGQEGRITLSMRRFIETKDGQRTEREIDYPGEFEDLLSSVFLMQQWPQLH